MPLRSGKSEAASSNGQHMPANLRDWAVLKEWARSALSRASLAMDNGRVVVLCYHSVHSTHPFASATPALFEEHISWLSAHCDIIRLSKAVDAARAARTGRPTVAVTFDDGYEDNHSNALPILAEHKVPATFFVTTGFADGDQAVRRRVAGLVGAVPEQITGMNWTQVRELRSAGMDVGSHTVTHPNLKLLSDDSAAKELSTSRAKIEDELGEPVRTLAYPFGLPRRSFSLRTMQLAAAAGYSNGAAVLFRDVRPSDHPLRIPRLAVAGDSLESLRRKIAGAFNWLGFYQEHAPMWAFNALSPDNERPPVTVARQ